MAVSWVQTPGLAVAGRARELLIMNIEPLVRFSVRIQLQLSQDCVVFRDVGHVHLAMSLNRYGG